MTNPRIGVIIPDRSDRPLFLMNCLRMLAAQTMQPEIIEIVNFKPTSEDCDITVRYRTGYNNLKGKNLDIIAFIENDDWYSPDYLEIMSKMWILSGKPTIFGLNHTIYYHIQAFSYFKMGHFTRSSAMNTLIIPDLNLSFGHDKDPYTDVWLWHHFNHRHPLGAGVTVEPPKHICLGIKHGVGKCGGQNHTDHMARFTSPDPDKSFIRGIMDPESFEFYSNYFNPVQAPHYYQYRASQM